MPEDEQVLDSFLASSSSPDEEGSADAQTDEEKLDEFVEEEKEESKEDKKAKEKAAKEGQKVVDDAKAKEEKIVEEVVSRVGDALSKGHDRVAALPTPGGIGLLLLALIIIVFALVPTKSGFTRLQLFYMVLTNKVRMSGAQYPDEGMQRVSFPTKEFTSVALPLPGPIPILPATPVVPSPTGVGGGIVSGGIPDFGVEELD